METKYRMLRKDGVGAPLPYTDILASRFDMKEFEMTRAEILAAQNGTPVKREFLTTPDQRPGKGYVLFRGKWSRKKEAK
jgi:hypothetical protein